MLKEPAHEQLTSAQIAQLHNEHIITRQLVGVPGLRPVYGLEGSESHPVLPLQYIEGQSLAEIIQEKSLELQQKLQLAVKIAGILGRIHDDGVMHRDINSSNIMVSADSLLDKFGRVSIIDFGVTTTVRQEEFSQPVTADTVAGTLAYISPEQTGRMNRAVDYRSGLYSLGVTLYELFTGQLPFQAGDTMGMIHAHMAVETAPPLEKNGELPKTLSAEHPCCTRYQYFRHRYLIAGINNPDRYNLWGRSTESIVLSHDDFSYDASADSTAVRPPVTQQTSFCKLLQR